MKNRLLLLALLVSTPALAQQTAQYFVRVIDAPATVRPGGQVAIAIAADNYGPVPAENAVVVIEPPIGAAARVDLPAGSPIKCDTSDPTHFECSVGTLVEGRTAFLTLVEFLPTAVGSYTTTISLRSATPRVAPMPPMNVVTRVSTDPDLYVSYNRPSGTRIDPGAPLGGTILVTNLGPADAHDVVVTFPSFANLTLTGGTSGTFTCTATPTGGRCTTPLLRAGETLALEPDIRVKPLLEGGRVVFAANAAAAEGEFDPRSNTTRDVLLMIYRTFVVSHTGDAAFGSLREAMLQASAGGCSFNEQPCKIAFAIDEPLPAAGWYTIAPRSPLPPIRSSGLVIEAATTKVELSGANLASGDGIVFESGPELELRGLSIGHFPGYGVVVAGAPGFNSLRIDGCAIGVDPAGNPAPNGRGIGIDGGRSTTITNSTVASNRWSGIFIARGGATTITGSTIANNGASGIYIGDAGPTTIEANAISGNRDFAIAIAPQAKSAIVRRTTMRGNGLFAIDTGLDLRTPNGATDLLRAPNAPVLTGARYDAATNTTIVSGTTSNVCNACRFELEVYASNALGPNGAPQAERFVTSVRGISSSGAFTIPLTGDLTGQFVTALVTRDAFEALIPPQVYGTSELSDAVQVTR